MLTVNLDKHKRNISQLDRAGDPASLPRRGELFVPVPLGRWVYSLRGAMRERGWKLGRAEYAIGNYYGQGTELAGSIDFSDSDLPPAAPLSTWSLGFQISNGGRHSPRAYFGGRFAGGEGFVASRRTWASCRELTEDLRGQAAEISGWAAHETGFVRRVLQDLRERELSQDEATVLAVRAGRLRLLPWSRIRVLDRELPESGATMADFARAFGAAAARNTPLDQLEQLRGCCEELLREAEILRDRG